MIEIKESNGLDIIQGMHWRIIETYDTVKQEIIAQVTINKDTGEMIDGFNTDLYEDDSRQVAIFCSEEATL